MGVTSLSMNRCDAAIHLGTLSAELNDRIIGQLTLDWRVVDVHLQRVLMTALTGAAPRLKPAWLARLLEAQHPDGGWGGFYSIVPLAFGYWYGVT